MENKKNPHETDLRHFFMFSTDPRARVIETSMDRRDSDKEPRGNET